MSAEVDGFRALRLRRTGICSECGVELPVGSLALWNQTLKSIKCQAHLGLVAKEPHQALDFELTEGSKKSLCEFDHGKSGSSAQAEHDRRSKKREDRVMARSPRIGKFLLAIYDDPQSTKAWSKGAEGEVRIGRTLDNLATKYGFIVLHDRQIPGRKTNVDHIAITSAGVVVIDSKFYNGEVRVKDFEGRFDEERRELWVGNRNCTKMVSGMQYQVRIVTEVLKPHASDFPIIGLLAFHAANWANPYKFLRKQEEISGVLINSKGVEPILARSGPFSGVQIDEVARILADKFKIAA